jgi:anti-sigma factor RsiW
MTQHRHDSEDAALDAVFAAARAETPAPRTELLNAILADAADETARRRPVPAPPARRQPRGWRPRSPGVFGALGGWPAAAALGACAAVGFVAGISGGSETAATLIWGEQASYDYSAGAAADEVIGLALQEG